MTTFKKVTLITRRDEQGVESFYNENEGIWYNDYGHKETENFIRKYVFPSVIIARFGGWNGVELTGDQWRDLQCPIRMTQEQLDAVLANQPAAVTAYEAERMNDPFRDGRLDDPRTDAEKAADAFNEEYSNDATISDIRTGFQQW